MQSEKFRAKREMLAQIILSLIHISEEAKTVRFIFLAFIYGYNYDQIAAVLTQKKRSTLRGRQEWNGVMVANIMKNERRWGDLEARKSIVVDLSLIHIYVKKIEVDRRKITYTEFVF